ncbi:olfactory receptor 10A7-like [Leptodactylus fuscus]|uniref:olfactory receptor 10A7-like n=1 Tax=Leptodactylus fuscus TaxID=238119 RepID=UPI003F4EE1BC
MSMKNQTRVTEFFLLGFRNLQNFNIVFFILFLIIFLFTVLGNFLIIILVSINVQLQSPMYYFLCHLSFSDLVVSTTIVPNMLGVTLLGGNIMNYLGCVTQMYFFSASTITECYLLAVMSYDRYLAICNPLRYSSIMDFKRQIILSVWPWLAGFTFNLIGVFPIFSLYFCDDNIIDHFFCDLSPLLKLSCSDTSLIGLLFLVCSLPFFIFPCSFVIVTYVYIFLTIYKIPSTTGKQKAFSTCSSHLIVVGTFYGTLIAKYMIPSKGNSLLINKTVSLLHTVFTPLFNPIIYSFRNQDIKMTLKKASGLIFFSS